MGGLICLLSAKLTQHKTAVLVYEVKGDLVCSFEMRVLACTVKLQKFFILLKQRFFCELVLRLAVFLFALGITNSTQFSRTEHQLMPSLVWI